MEVTQALEMINQMLDQMSAAQFDQPARSAGQTRKGEGRDFDDLLQQKRGETSKPGDGQQDQAVQGQDASRQPAQADQPQMADQEEVPEDAMAVLAAMMFQPQQQQQVEVQAGPAQTAEAAAPVEGAEVAEMLTQAAPEQGEVLQTAPQQGQQQAAAVEAQDGEQVQEQQRVDAPQEAPAAAAAEGDSAPQQVRETDQAPRQEQRQDDGEQSAPEARHVEAAHERTPVHAEQQVETAQEEAPVETPLFQPEMESAPVKVAENVVNPEDPVPLDSAETPERVVDVMEQCLQQDGTEKIAVIQVEPENLGPVTMRLTRDAEGVIHMVLEALNPKTAELLDKHAAEIQNIAASNTREDVRVEIKSEQSQPFPENWKENQEQQQRQQQRQQREDRSEPLEDFVHRLRLGLDTDRDA